MTVMKTILLTTLGAVFLQTALLANTVELKLRSDQPVVEAGKTQTILIKVDVKGKDLPVADRPPVNLSIVIDKSGSMSGDRIEYARKGAIEALRRLGKDDIFSVVTYDSNVHTLIPAQKLTNLDQAEQLINRIQASDMTNIYGGLEAGFAELEKNFDKNYLNRMILLSDGLANVGKNQPQDFAELGRTFSGKGVVVSTVGLGSTYNEKLMSDLAQSGEGNNYYVQDPETLPKLFEAEIGHLVSTVARGVTIKIELPANIQIEGVRGREFRQKGNHLEIDFHDLVAGQNKFTLLELTIPEGSDGAILETLKAHAVYHRASDNQLEEASGTTSIRYTASTTEAENATQHDVRDAWAELRKAEIQEEVLALVANNRRDEAIKVLNDAPADAKARGWNNAADQLDAFKTEEETILKERAFTPEETRWRQNEAYKNRNQQTTDR